MEITKMLTLSTGHIKESTIRLLEEEPDTNRFPTIGVYEKGEYGFFVYLTNDELPNSLDKLPADLAAVVKFTLDAGCSVLCLDCDGEELLELPFYDGNSMVRPSVGSENGNHTISVVAKDYLGQPLSIGDTVTRICRTESNAFFERAMIIGFVGGNSRTKAQLKTVNEWHSRTLLEWPYKLIKLQSADGTCTFQSLPNSGSAAGPT